MQNQMRAAVYRGADQMVVEVVPVPAIGTGEVLVRLAWCGVCGTDIKKIHYGLVDPPRIFGHEMAGEIVLLGDGVQDWQVGDRVAVMHHIPCLSCYYCNSGTYAQCPTYKRTGTTAGFEPAGGGFAQYIRVMDWIVERGMVKIPAHVSLEEATFIEPVNTVLKGVERTGARAGQSALVVGQGQIGLLYTQLLRRDGVAVYATDRIDFRLEMARKMGATAAFHPDRVDEVKEIKALTDGRGVNIAIVAVANNEVIARAFEAVRPGGKVLLFAQTRMGDPIQVDAGAICMLEKDLIGSYSADIHLQAESARLIFSGEIDVRSLITHRFPLGQISEAIGLAASPRDNSLKVLVEI